MTQDTEAKRSAPGRAPQSAPPGIGLTIGIALISGVLCWSWLTSGQADPGKSTAPNISALTEVAEADIDGALTTTSLPNAVSAQFKQTTGGGCRRPLAWVSLVSAPGEPPSRIRLISGNYFSPIFDVSATPARVALPFPAPYESGRGTLTAIDEGGGATISLLPSWRVSAKDGKTTHAVTWHPVKNCGQHNG